MVIITLSGQQTNIRVQFNETIAKPTDTGDLTLNDTISGSILWESFDYPSNSLLPGMKLGTRGKTQGRNLLTSWKTMILHLESLYLDFLPRSHHKLLVGMVLSRIGEMGHGMEGSS